MPFIVSTSQQGSDVLSVPSGYEILYDSGLGIVEAVPGELGPQAIVKYRLYNSNERYSFVQQLLGQWTGVAPANILYIGPFAYPPSPNLVCTSVLSIESLGKFVPSSITNFLNQSVGLPYWFGKGCVVTAQFTRPTWQAATSGGYFEIDFAGAGEILLAPETTYTFSDGTPTNTPVAINLQGAEINVTRYRMPFLPDQYMIACAGMLNNAPFQIGNNIYAEGTLLFAPGNSSTRSDPLGNLTYNAQYKFLYRYPGWNYSLHPNGTSGWEIVTDGNGNPPYQYANFNILP